MPAVNEMPAVSQAELAAIFGVTPQTIKAWERNGCPVERKGGHGKASLYKPADVIRWREEQARLAVAGNLATLDTKEASRRRLIAQAAREEIALAREMGEVVSFALVERTVTGCFSACRAELQQVGAKVAPLLHLATHAAAAKEMIDAAINEALDAISDDAFGFGEGAREEAEEDSSSGEGGDDEVPAEADPERMGGR